MTMRSGRDVKIRVADLGSEQVQLMLRLGASAGSWSDRGSQGTLLFIGCWRKEDPVTTKVKLPDCSQFICHLTPAGQWRCLSWSSLACTA